MTDPFEGFPDTNEGIEDAPDIFDRELHTMFVVAEAQTLGYVTSQSLAPGDVLEVAANDIEGRSAGVIRLMAIGDETGLLHVMSGSEGFRTYRMRDIHIGSLVTDAANKAVAVSGLIKQDAAVAIDIDGFDFRRGHDDEGSASYLALTFGRVWLNNTPIFEA